MKFAFARVPTDPFERQPRVAKGRCVALRSLDGRPDGAELRAACGNRG